MALDPKTVGLAFDRRPTATMTIPERDSKDAAIEASLERYRSDYNKLLNRGYCVDPTTAPGKCDSERAASAADILAIRAYQQEFRDERATVEPDYEDPDPDRASEFTPEEQLEQVTQQSDPEAIAAAEEAQRQLEEDRARANEIIESRGLDRAEVFADYNACLEACADLEETEAANCKQSCDVLEEAIIAELLAPTVEYKEQCFLLANIFELVELKRLKDRGTGDLATETTEPQKRLPYYNTMGNASLLVDGDPYRFMNQLTQYPSQAKLYDLTTADLSHLQPMIRLFKVTETDGTPPEALQEIRFESYLSQDEVTGILDDPRVRGVGVGIKDFTFSFEADNPFAIKKSIKAKLTLFANNFDELLRDRSKSGEVQWTYADLALKTGTSLMKNNIDRQRWGGDLVYDPDKLNFRLKAVVGWARPKGETAFSDDPLLTEGPTIMDAIGDSYISLNLTPTVHEFDIDDMGRVTFTIDYLAYVEDFFDQPGFNIFGDETVSFNHLKRKLIYQDLIQGCGNSEKLKEYQEKWKDQIRDDKEMGLKSLLTKLQGDPARQKETSKIYILSIDYSEIEDFMSKGPYYNKSSLADSISNVLSTNVQDAIMLDATAAFVDPDDADESTAGERNRGQTAEGFLEGGTPAPIDTPRGAGEDLLGPGAD